MGIFGKDNTEAINKLISQMNSNTKTIDVLITRINSMNEIYDSMQDLMIKAATVQAQHKEFISFLINNATMSEDAQEEAKKMLMRVLKLNKVKEK